MKIPFPEASRYRNITATVSAARGMPGDTYDDIYVRAMRSQSVAKRIGGNCIAFKEHTFRPDGENKHKNRCFLGIGFRTVDKLIVIKATQ